jgi:hypothetical protein
MPLSAYQHVAKIEHPYSVGKIEALRAIDKLAEFSV